LVEDLDISFRFRELFGKFYEFGDVPSEIIGN
jgi:hypothetical protein